MSKMPLSTFRIELQLPYDVEPSRILELAQTMAREACEHSNTLSGMTEDHESCACGQCDNTLQGEIDVDDIMQECEDSVSVEETAYSMVRRKLGAA